MAGEGAEWIRTCSIVTGAIHNRMLVILPKEVWPAWLGEEPATSKELKALLKPYPAERMRLYPVGTRVNSPKNDEPELLEAV